MIFSNYNELILSKERKIVLDLASEGIKSVLPENFMPQAIRIDGNYIHVKENKYYIKDKRIFIVGTGKASATMAIELEKILTESRITAGIVTSNDSISNPIDSKKLLISIIIRLQRRIYYDIFRY